MGIRIAFIGAGSLGFTRKLITDLLCVPEFNDAEFNLMDISVDNLQKVHKLIKRDITANHKPARVRAYTNRKKALEGADYVVCTIRQGGLEAFETDVEIPLRYGVDQCVGDTLCAGGIMYGQRGIPAFLDICRDMQAVAKPDALLLNYSNPMAMMTWAGNHFGKVRMLGLCHGVQGGHHQIANVLGKKPEEVDIICAGINHQTWYIRIKADGRLIGAQELLEGFEKHLQYSKDEKVRIDVLRRIGYYSTESNGHLSEYLPWYRKSAKDIRRWSGKGAWIHGETGGYLRVCRENRNWFETDYPNLLQAPPAVIDPARRSVEHGSYIIEALETGRTYRGHFNVVNNGTITNLPDDAIVEVPGYVDGNGINIPKVGDLPLACAASLHNSINVQRMAVHAAVAGDPVLLKQAMLHDPLVGAMCSPEEVWQMTDRMLVAGEKWLPQYKTAVKEAAARLKKEKDLRRKKTAGAFRLKTKTVGQMKKNAAEARKKVEHFDPAVPKRGRVVTAAE